MRDPDAKLRTCPTCGTKVEKVEDLGLRDYTWINTRLPGTVGLMDIDGVLERKGHILMLETKPLHYKGLPLGQRLTLKAFVRLGVHVWVCWSDGDQALVGRMDERGETPFVEDVGVEGLVERIEQWYDDADKGRL
jgi:hypothetical protein